MNQNNYWRIAWMVAYLAFATVSCWATASSLHLLLSSWPAVFCWAITIGFFVVASLGTKMIVDSLNQNIYLEKRGWRLFGGMVLVLVFWIICSFPTNTHTFFYRTVINEKVTADIATTRGYLNDIKNNTKNVDQAKLKITELKNEIGVLLGELEAEIKNEAQPGFGPKSKEILRKFAVVLEVDKIEPLSYRGTSKQDRDKLCDAYRTKMYILADSKAKNIMNNVMHPTSDNMKEVSIANKNLTLLKQHINDGVIDLNNPKDMTGGGGVCEKLNEGYLVVKKNQDFVNFSSTEDKEAYTANNPITKVRGMISVVDVWRDFMHGEYKGYGFIFWIVISLLVDIAAFIFFDMAFKKTDY